MKLINNNKIFLIVLGAFLILNTAISFADDKATQSSDATLSDSFMGAFGMNSDASGSTGEGGSETQSSSTNSNAGALASGMTSVTSFVSNQVTTTTPYSHQN